MRFASRLNANTANGALPHPPLAEAVIEHLAPIRKRYGELVDDPQYLKDVLADGAQAASEVADRTVADVKQAMGFSTVDMNPVLNPLVTPKKK